MTKKGRGPGEGVQAVGAARRSGSRGSPPWMRSGAVALVVLLLQAACITRAPMSGRVGASGPAPVAQREKVARPESPSLEPVVVIEVDVLVPGGSTRVVAVTKGEYQRAV